MKKLVYSLFSIVIIVSINVFVLINYIDGIDTTPEPIDLVDKNIFHKKTTTTTRRIITDNTVYDKLSIKSLYVKASNSDDNSKILWYLKDGIYYLFLPKLIDCNNMFIEFDAGVDTYLSIYDGETLVDKIASNESVKLEKKDYIFKLESNVKEVTTYNVRIMKSEVPALFVNIEGGDASFQAIKADRSHNKYYPGIASIADDDNNIKSASFKKFKGRGNATWRRNKRPFALKFDKKISILGMKEAKNWTLLANYFDGTMARNEIWLSFSRDIGLEYSPESKTVELYVNNKYEGTYTLTSKVEVKENRVELDEDDFLVEMDIHIGKNNFRLNHGFPVKVHYPDPEDYTSEDRSRIFSEIKSYLNKIESLIYNQSVSYEELSKYIDLESFAKYYWVNEISLNMDASRNSVYFYRKDGILYAGPVWDMDATMNRSYEYTKTTGYYILDDGKLPGRIAENWFRPLMKREGFSDLVDKVYIDNQELFNDLPNRLERYYDYILDSSKMNYTRWPYAGMIKNQWDIGWISGNHDFESAYSMFLGDVKKRVDWYKKEYANLNFSDIIYKVFSDEKEIKSSKVSFDKTIFIPKSAKRIEIYGESEVGEKVLLKEVEISDSLIDASFELSNKISSNYKKNNSYKYNITFTTM